MHCQLKQAACRLGRCPTYVQDRRMLAGPYPTCTERHMTLLVRQPRLATKLARQRERKVPRSFSQPLTGLMLSLTSHLETAGCVGTGKTPLGGKAAACEPEVRSVRRPGPAHTWSQMTRPGGAVA